MLPLSQLMGSAMNPKIPAANTTAMATTDKKDFREDIHAFAERQRSATRVLGAGRA
ncbi:MAG: hypothetical protein NVV63_18405 [Opitutus sp.]|nr:hypothetical protein [Opitutus sp.]